MSNMDRLQVVDVCCTNYSAHGCWCTGAGFAPSELSTRFSVCCENCFTANNTTPAATARLIPTLHPSPELPSVVFGSEETCVFEAFLWTACSSLLVALQLKTASFVAANSAVSTCSFCRRDAAPLRPASCFLGSFTVAVVSRSDGFAYSACSCSFGTSIVSSFGTSTWWSILIEGVVFNTTLVTMLGCG